MGVETTRLSGWYRLGLRVQLALASSVLVALLAWGQSHLAGRHAAAELEQRIGAALVDTAQNLAELLDRAMWSRSGEVRVLASLSAFRELRVGGEVEEILATLQEALPVYTWVGLTDRDGVLLAATGTASLAGAVEVTAIDPHVSYADGQSYTILTATEPLEGTFTGASMRNHSAFLTPTLRQDSDTVTLDIAVTSDFTIAGDTANQRQTAAALNGLAQEGDALAVFNAIAGLDEVQARAAFDLASGEVHATGGQVIEQATGLFSGTLRGQGAAGLGAASPGTPRGIVSRRTGETGHALLAHSGGARAWFAPLGGRGSIEGDGNAATLDWWSGGIAGSYEAPVDTAAGNAVAGIALGYLRSRGTVDARRSSLEADGLHIGVYGAWEDGPWQLSGALAYAASHVSTARGVVFGGIDRTARADYWTHSLGFSGEAAYRIDLGGGTTLMPLATLDAGWSGHGGFTETGAGALNLTGASESRTRLDTGIGFGIRHVMRTETGRMVLEGRAVWEHALGDTRSGQSLGLAGSPVGFEVLGPSARRDRLRLGAGVAWDIAPDMTLRASYDGVFAGGERTHSGAISLNIRF